MFELMPTSAFIQRLNRGGITQPGTRYTQIVTRYDDVVVPTPRASSTSPAP